MNNVNYRQENLTNDDGHESEEEEPIQTSFNRNIVESKELLHFRRDSVTYFVASNGDPYDEGCSNFIEANKILAKQALQIGSVNETKWNNNKYLFRLCIREEIPESQEIIKNNLRVTFKLLPESLIIKKIKEFSIAKSSYIENISWNDVIKLIKEIFMDNSIKTIVCKGNLEYVVGSKRDDIFRELPNLPIGGHKGVSKTLNRIPENCYWENLKQNVQRRIQQCIQWQLKKLVRLKTKKRVVITDTPCTTFEKIALDIVGPLPKTENDNEYILTMQYQLSKFCLAKTITKCLSYYNSGRIYKECYLHFRST